MNNNEVMSEELEMVVFSIVGNAGEAKSLAHEALSLSEEGKFEEAQEMMKKSNEAVLKAHGVQTDLIQKEADGERTPMSMLFVHAQDHLMTAISEKQLIAKLIKMNERLHRLEQREV